MTPPVFKPNENFYRNHITFTSVAQVRQLAKSSLSQLGLSYFTFDRYYKDGSHFKLTTHGGWIEDFYREGLYKECLWDNSLDLFNDCQLPWSCLNRDPIYSKAALHDIDHGLSIVKNHKEYCDFYNFGTTCNNKIPMPYLISNLDHLHKFIAIFHAKAFQLINIAKKSRFILPNALNQNISLSEIVQNISPQNISDIRQLYLGEDFDNVYLTGTELKIIYHMLHDKKQVEIAKLLFVSDKTVESHAAHIKDKLKCNTMFALGHKVMQLGIDKIFRL
jgi:DNA-binding CsgD family transcriptional regulator